MIVLDSSVCIDILRERPGGLTTRSSRIKAEGGVLSTIVLTELYAGAWGRRAPDDEEEQIEILRSVFETVNFDVGAAKAAGRIFASLKGSGRGIGVQDVLIGAHALALGAPVLTADTEHFDRIEGLAVVAWE